MSLFLKQGLALTRKTILIVAVRHPIVILLRAVIIPLLVVLILAFAREFFNGYQLYGVGPALPVPTFEDALARDSNRNVFAFANNGLVNGDIAAVIESLSGPIEAAGKTVEIHPNNTALERACAVGPNGRSNCFAGVIFDSSPTEPEDGGIWNYTLRNDGSINNAGIDIESPNNPTQVYILSVQKAVDAALVARSRSTGQSELPAEIDNLQYTYASEDQRQDEQRAAYLRACLSVFGAFFYFSMIDVILSMTGFIASERELGMTQLIDAMVPGRSRRKAQILRLASTYAAFVILYMLTWLAVGVILSRVVFPTTSAGIVIVYHLLVGLSNCSFAMFGAMFFRKSQLSGSIMMVIAVVLFILPQFYSSYLTTESMVIGLSLFFPFSNYTYFIGELARWELRGMPMNLGSASPMIDYKNWSIPEFLFWIFLLIQILLYPAAASLVENLLWSTASSGRKVQRKSDNEAPLTLRDFEKTYHRLLSKKSNVCAVKGLSFNAPRGQISMLLGPNGSGKSTTLDAIAGLTTVTSGSIDVDTTGGLGIAPQKNVLWNDVTVKEHIEIFAKLKTQGPADFASETRLLLDACDLREKANARAKTLSGGQKRKLQLAIMFAGGSKVCCVDEVSSGLDPLSRRKIWDILLAERGTRTIVMTTHFLDEAEFLADNILILSKGALKAQGSAAELKHRLGNGYSIHITDASNVRLPADLGAAHSTQDGNRTTFQARTSAEAANMLEKLEREHIYNYQVSGPTIEELFLKMTQESVPSVNGEEKNETVIKVYTEIDLRDGKPISFWKQGWYLYRKRLTILRRTYMPYFTAVALALIGAGVSPALLSDYSRPDCPVISGADTVSYSYVDSLAQSYSADYGSGYSTFVLGPQSRISNESLQIIVDTYAQNATFSPGYTTYGFPNLTALYESFVFVETIDEFNALVSETYGTYLGGVYLSDPAIVYWQAATYSTGRPHQFQNIADILLTNVPISSGYSAFSDFQVPNQFDFFSLIFVVLLGLVFAAYPAFFALYPTTEKLRKMRAMQYSNGVRPLPLWLAYLVFDGMFVLIISVVCTILLSVGFGGWYQLQVIFAVLLLYGFAAVLLGYVLSLFAPSSLAAWSFSAIGQVVLYFACFGGVIGIQSSASYADLGPGLSSLQYGLGIISPIVNVQRALFVGLGLFATLCDDSGPAAMNRYGSPILYLVLQILILFCILLWCDSGLSPMQLLGIRKTARDHEETIVSSSNDEFARELARVNSSTEGLRVKHLSKSFGSHKAVDDVTFGILPGEIFGLLGPNGAGKTTAISLIRGDISPSTKASSIDVDHASVLTNRATARSLLGVCPQFDCADNMTVMQNLTFFARIRGVTEVQHNVSSVIDACGLAPFADKLAYTLSGGTKRKLSLAIALVGNPHALLLDEPSSGLDAKAKRVMWSTLASVARERAVLLTTHSMEEADALAHRVGIMASRMLALGTCNDMRRRGGDVYHVHLALESAPHTTQEEADSIKSGIQEHITGAVVERETYGGQVRFSVMAAEGQVTVGELFRILESEKEALGVGFYSVGRTTLDEVFVSVVREHGGKEEGAEIKESRGLFGLRKE